MAKAGDFIKKFTYMKKETVSSGILPLDIVLNGGIELGGAYAIASPAGGGKSTLCLQVCKNFCDSGRYVFYLDIEQGVKQSQLEGAGLDKYLEPLEGETYPRFQITNQIYSYNDTQDAIRDIILMKKENICPFSLVVTDSLSSLVSENILEGHAEAATMAADARPLSKVIKSIRGPLGVSGITLFNIVQAASNIGANPMFHEPEWVAKVTKQLEHAVDVLLLLEHPQFKSYAIMGKKKTPDGEVDVQIGYYGKLYTTKARVGLNRIKINIPMISGKGADSLLYLQNVLVSTGVFVKRGETYKYKDSSGSEQTIKGDIEYKKFVLDNYDTLVKMLYDLGYFDLTNNATISQIASIEPANIGDGSVSEQELRNEAEGTLTLGEEDEQFV